MTAPSLLPTSHPQKWHGSNGVPATMTLVIWEDGRLSFVLPSLLSQLLQILYQGPSKPLLLTDMDAHTASGLLLSL